MIYGNVTFGANVCRCLHLIDGRNIVCIDFKANVLLVMTKIINKLTADEYLITVPISK